MEIDERGERVGRRVRRERGGRRLMREESDA